AQPGLWQGLPYHGCFGAELAAMVLARSDGRVAKVARIGDVVIGQPAREPEPVQRLHGQITVARQALEIAGGRYGVGEALVEKVGEIVGGIVQPVPGVNDWLVVAD